MIKVFCNQCGKEINKGEPKQSLNICIGDIGSEFDGGYIHIDLHSHCFDEAMSNMMSKFAMLPIIEGYGECDGECETCNDISCEQYGCDV